MDKMESWQKAALRQHKESIAQKVVEAERSDDLIYDLQLIGVISQATAKYLLSTETTKTSRIRLLVDELTECGYGSYEKFLEILTSLNLTDLVAIVDPQYYQQIAPVTRGESDDLDLRRTPFHSQVEDNLCQLPTLPRPQATPGPTPTQVPRLQLAEEMDAENNNPDQSLKIHVVPYRILNGGTSLSPAEIYRNETKPRGLVFIANYHSFINNAHPVRTGSDIDVKNLTMLFTQMGYRIHTQAINYTKYETIQALREFCSLEELARVDSVVVVMMSHGQDNASFYTSDNLSLSVNEVVKRFSNRDCPMLLGKPKMFIFQYCRGTSPDIGVQPRPQRVSNPQQGLRVQTDSANFGEAVVNRDPTFTDMYIVYSTVEGFVSFRHPLKGSWLMEAICCVFMKHACSHDLDSLMKMVSRRIRENYTDEGNKQVCEFVQRGFDRHLYFNPQPLSEMMALNLDSLSQALTEDGRQYLPREHLSPKYRRRPQGRSSSRDSRHRNRSGASISSHEGSMENLLMSNLRPEAAPVHPRVRSLTPNQRRVSLPCPSNLQHPLQQPWNRSFSESEENMNQLSQNVNRLPQNVIALNYSLTPLSPPASPASPDIQSYDVVDHPCTDPNSNITNGGTPNNRIMEATGVSPMTVSNESVFTSGESISPTSSEEGAKCIIPPLSHSTSGPVYLPSIGSFAGPEERTPGEDMRLSFKRHLSVPSSKETLEKVNDVRRYLQVHDSDSKILTSLQRVESFVNKKKNEVKRRKMEERNANSQEH